MSLCQGQIPFRHHHAWYCAQLAAACACKLKISPILSLIILASTQAPSAANNATPQTPARAPPVVPRPLVRAAQAREVIVTSPPPPVFHRASALSPPSPKPVLPDEESHDKLDFLGSDPFGATLAKVKALY